MGHHAKQGVSERILNAMIDPKGALEAEEPTAVVEGGTAEIKIEQVKTVPAIGAEFAVYRVTPAESLALREYVLSVTNPAPAEESSTCSSPVTMTSPWMQ